MCCLVVFDALVSLLQDSVTSCSWFSIVPCVWLLAHPFSFLFFFLMIRRPPRSTLDRSSAASDVYKRQVPVSDGSDPHPSNTDGGEAGGASGDGGAAPKDRQQVEREAREPVSYTHLRAHETVLDLVCRLLLEKKKNTVERLTETKNYNARTKNEEGA